MKKDSRELLEGLGLNPDAPNLVPDTPAKTTKKTKAVVPDGVDPHTMNPDHIQFDPHLLDDFPNLEDNEVRSAATQHVFSQFKSKQRDKARNSLLWRLVNKFVQDVRLSRKTSGVVKEKIKTTGEQRDLAQVVASLGITAEDLIELAKKKGES